MSFQLPETHLKALRWLELRGGGGVLDRYGRLLAAGDVYPQGAATVWLRLVTTGHVAGDGRLRLCLTDLGRSAAS